MAQCIARPHWEPLVQTAIHAVPRESSVLASPRIPLGVNGGRGGRSLELVDVESGGVSGRHCGQNGVTGGKKTQKNKMKGLDLSRLDRLFRCDS